MRSPLYDAVAEGVEDFVSEDVDNDTASLEDESDISDSFIYSSTAEHSGHSKIYDQVNNAHYNEWFDSWFDDNDDAPPDECGWDACDDDAADWDIAEREGPLHEDDVMWELIQR